MKANIVSFSGGRTSAYLVHCIEQMRKDGRLQGPVEYIFMDTGAEHPKTYEFIKKCVAHFGIELTCLRARIPLEAGKGSEPVVVSIDDIGPDLKPFREMLAKYSTPYNPGGAFCTDRMKSVPAIKYLNEKYGRNNFVQWLGIRIDEPLRIKDKPGFRYLAHISSMEKDDILGWWSEMPFDLEIEEWLGNCVFCIKKGANKIALAAKDEPELAAQFWEMLLHESVRQVEREKGTLIMYRGFHSLQSIIDIYKDVPREEIINSLRRSKRFDSGSCSESCEAFACQLDLFEEDGAA